jgi:hypothetical protein
MQRLIAAIIPVLCLAASAAWAQSAPPQHDLIERDIPGASKTPPEEVRLGAAKSNAVLRELGPDFQRVHSHVAGDNVYCVYQATNEDLICEHAAKSGFSAIKVTPITAVPDPTTAGRP